MIRLDVCPQPVWCVPETLFGNDERNQERVHVKRDTQCRKTDTNCKDTTPARHHVEDTNETWLELTCLNEHVSLDVRV